MTDRQDKSSPAADSLHGPPDGRALERLRDRTDELELIISSLTTFTLFSLPGWVYGTLAGSYTHLSTGLAIAGLATTTILTGVCYGLGACFVFHLMARAYWVGLIGLRAAFPDGIDWRRTRTLGPLTLRYYRRRLPALNTIIDSTDRLASSLFAVISMLTIGCLWFGALMVGVLAAAGIAGARFGLTNTALGIASLALATVFIGAPLIAYLLDAGLLARWPRLRRGVILPGLIHGARRLSGIAYPRRLVLPVQLTLQSNTRPIAFFLALTFTMVVIVTIGNLRVTGWRDFTMSGEFTYLGDAQLVEGLYSTYYEDMQSPKDALRAWPRISSFNQSGAAVTLFIPYQPLRDNLVLDQLCSDAEREADPAACLRALWQLRLDGRVVPLDDFLPAERADLAMRGLLGLVLLENLQPGLRRLELTWNPLAEGADEVLDDRYSEATRRYLIPFAFNPAYEQALPDPR